MTYLSLFQCVKFQLSIIPLDVPTHLLLLLFRLVLSSPTTAVPGYYVPSQILDELSAGFDVLHHVRPDSLKQGVPASKIDYLSMGSADLTAEGIFLCGSGGGSSAYLSDVLNFFVLYLINHLFSMQNITALIIFTGPLD